MTNNLQFYFEDLKIGDEYVTGGRTITETDVINFSGVSGDFSDIHLDREVGKATIFGQNIAHGLCTLSIASGNIVRTGLLSKIIAFLHINDWHFSGPVFFGDTVKARVRISDKKETFKQDRGVVIFSIELFNQRDEVVQKGKWTIMISRRTT